MRIIIEFGKIAGIAGISLGVFLFLFKEIIAKKIFPKMSPEHGYKIINRMITVIGLITVLSIGLWAFFEYLKVKGNSNVEKPDTSIKDTINTIKKPIVSQSLTKPSSKTNQYRKNEKNIEKNENEVPLVDLHNYGTIGNLNTSKGDMKIDIKEQNIGIQKDTNNNQ